MSIIGLNNISKEMIMLNTKTVLINVMLAILVISCAMTEDIAEAEPSALSNEIQSTDQLDTEHVEESFSETEVVSKAQ